MSTTPATNPLRSVRLRVTAGATIVFALAFGLAAVLLVNRVRSSLEDEVRRESNNTVVYLKQSLESGAPLVQVEAAVPSDKVGYRLTDKNGRVIGSSGAAAPPPGPGSEAVAAPPAKSLPPGAADASPGGELGDRYFVFSRADTAQGPVSIAVAGPFESVRQSIDALTRVLFVGTPVLVLAVGALIWFFVGRALRPVDAMCDEVNEITHSTLHRRVATGGANDEMDRLANTMNDMLDRLEGASERQRRFVSDASHELKTPLTTIRTSVEVGLHDPSTADWETIARRVLVADKQMEVLVSDLLDLARLDELASIDRTELVDLEELVLQQVRDRPDAGRIEVSDVLAGRLPGDRRSLDRMVGNLINNAAAHADARVVVRLHQTEDDVELVVDDDGPGIPLEERDHVFERFTRLDEARTNDAGPRPRTNGTGLGLAIVKTVVDRHDGTIAVGDSPLGGARFIVHLPTSLVPLLADARSGHSVRSGSKGSTSSTQGAD